MGPPSSYLRISARTLAVLRFESTLPEGPPTRIVGVELNLPWLASNAQHLADVFGDLVTALLHLTEGATVYFSQLSLRRSFTCRYVTKKTSPYASLSFREAIWAFSTEVMVGGTLSDPGFPSRNCFSFCL